MQATRHNSRQAPLVITVTGGKGGIGKSNIALNLSLALQQQSQVILMDGDLGLANINVLLGLDLKRNLSHVLQGECQLTDAMITITNGLQIIPASSGKKVMVDLNEMELGGIIHAFSQYTQPLDYLVIDTAAGIVKSVGCFAAASHEVIVVLCNEPAALTDTYALIKVFKQDYNISRYRVLVNMVDNDHEARKVFSKLTTVIERFLDVSIQYMGYVPYDELFRKSVQQQKPVLMHYSNSRVALKFKDLAKQMTNWRLQSSVSGGLEFFLERRLSTTE